MPSPDLLRDLLVRARSARSTADVADVLRDVAEYAATATTMSFAVIDLHRPQWNDFETVAVYGSEELVTALLGTTTQWAFWAPKLAPEYARGSVQHVGPGGQPGVEVEGPWQASEVLFSPLRRPTGELAGILRIGSPIGGGRPTDAQLDILALCAEFAVIAIEAVDVARTVAGSRAAFDGLADIASRPPNSRHGTATVADVCRQVQSGLGFGRVSVFASEPTGILRPVSTIGWDESSALLDHPWLSLTQLPLLFANAHLQHGCALLEADAVRALLDLKVPLPVGRKNGDGPLAWKDHLLLLALADPEGRPVGVLWADEPSDRLLPGPEALAALRVFAGQAAAALALSRRQPQQLGADELTGLPTRETLADRLGHALRRNQRTETGVAVLFLDVDRFAQINQRLGHVAGDELLQRIAARLDDALRPSDTVARFGGDEFVAVCEDVGDGEQALEVAERLRVALAPPIPTSAGHVPVTVSIGVALAAPHSAEADALLQAADRAMYEAKAAGRDAARLASRDAEWDA